MTSQRVTQYRPTEVSPPGESLAEILEERGWTQAELSVRMGRPTKSINEIIKGKAAITPETALQLERALGTTADFWLARESRYRTWLARKQDAEQRKGEVGWLQELPLAEMIRFGWVERRRPRVEQVVACLDFFGVASVEAWRNQYAEPLAAFRASPSFKLRIGAVAAWLRQGERAAAAIVGRPFDKVGFRRVLFDLRGLTRESEPDVFVPALVEACAAHGVAVVFVPTPKGCPASGATRFTGPDRAILQLSLRHGTNDHLWFTFFHEAGHLVLHGKRPVFLEGTTELDPVPEAEADGFARDLLIPPAESAGLAALGHSADAVQAFADRLGIAPGIVVGRLQKEGRLPWSHLNDLKVRYRLTAGEAGDE